MFVSKAKVVAGFTQNQGAWRCTKAASGQRTEQRARRAQRAERARAAPAGYGMGGNTMTSEQKSLLIYGACCHRSRGAVRSFAGAHAAARVCAGSLAVFFGLFIAGYLLD